MPQESRAEARLFGICFSQGALLKIAPTVASMSNELIVQWLSWSGVIVPVFVQLEDQPPKATPLRAWAVKVTTLPTG